MHISHNKHTTIWMRNDLGLEVADGVAVLCIEQADVAARPSGAMSHCPCASPTMKVCPGEPHFYEQPVDVGFRVVVPNFSAIHARHRCAWLRFV